MSISQKKASDSPEDRRLQTAESLLGQYKPNFRNIKGYADSEVFVVAGMKENLASMLEMWPEVDQQAVLRTFQDGIDAAEMTNQYMDYNNPESERTELSRNIARLIRGIPDFGNAEHTRRFLNKKQEELAQLITQQGEGISDIQKQELVKQVYGAWLRLMNRSLAARAIAKPAGSSEQWNLTEEIDKRFSKNEVGSSTPIDNIYRLRTTVYDLQQNLNKGEYNSNPELKQRIQNICKLYNECAAIPHEGDNRHPLSEMLTINSVFIDPSHAGLIIRMDELDILEDQLRDFKAIAPGIEQCKKSKRLEKERTAQEEATKLAEGNDSAKETARDLQSKIETLEGTGIGSVRDFRTNAETAKGRLNRAQKHTEQAVQEIANIPAPKLMKGRYLNKVTDVLNSLISQIEDLRESDQFSGNIQFDKLPTDKIDVREEGPDDTEKLRYLTARKSALETRNQRLEDQKQKAEEAKNKLQKQLSSLLQSLNTLYDAINDLRDQKMSGRQLAEKCNDLVGSVKNLVA